MSVWDGYGEGLVVRMVRMDGLTVSIIIQTLVTNLRKTWLCHQLVSDSWRGLLPFFSSFLIESQLKSVLLRYNCSVMKHEACRDKFLLRLVIRQKCNEGLVKQLSNYLVIYILAGCSHALHWKFQVMYTYWWRETSWAFHLLVCSRIDWPVLLTGFVMVTSCVFTGTGGSLTKY